MSASTPPDSNASKSLLRAELTARVREALDLRDWAQLEHWAKHWIQLDPRHPSGFKWLARASLALGQMPRAAYAYGRLLDFEPKNDEALQFFAQNPSIRKADAARVPAEVPANKTPPPGPESSLAPEARQQLAELELGVAEGYSRHRLFAEAARRFRASFDWRPTQAAALGLARSLHNSQQGFEATRFLRDQLYHFPDWIDGRLLLGRVLYDIGSRAEAQREWQLVLEQDPRNEQALGFLRLLMTASL